MSIHHTKPNSNLAVRIRIFWGETLLDAVELCPPRPYFIGDASESAVPVDYTVPGLHAARVPLVSLEGTDVRVHVPIGARATRRDPSKKKAAAPSAPAAPPSAFAMPAAFSLTPVEEPLPAIDGDPLLDDQTPIDVEVGALRFSLSLGAKEERAPRAFGGEGDLRPLGYFGVTGAVAAALVGSMAYFMPPLGLTDDDDIDRDRMYLMSTYLDAAAEREQKLEQTPSPEAGGGSPNAAPEQGAHGESGKMGKLDSHEHGKRASGTNPGAEPRIATSREEEISLAKNFGIIGMLATGSTGTPAPWTDAGVGDALKIGEMFGSEIGESGGSNGLGLFGMGSGGGEHGDTVGLLSVGTCRGEACTHGLDHSGIGGGRTGPGHVARAPQIRPQGITTLDGTLPAEVIQRVVRQSFGRFRSCYENGLRTNPTLEGRVTARFVIARDGSVATVSSGGSDLPDPGVVRCVLGAYSGLSFPAPKEGIVRVSYPLMFSPSA